MFKTTTANTLIALTASFTLAACDAPDESSQQPNAPSNSSAGSNSGSSSQENNASSANTRALPSGADTRIARPNSATRSSALTVEAVAPDFASVSASGASDYVDRINALVDAVFVHVDRAHSTEPTTQDGDTTTWNLLHDGTSTQLVLEDRGDNIHDIAFTSTDGLIAMSGVVALGEEGFHKSYELSLSIIKDDGEQVALDITMLDAGEVRVLDYDFVQARGTSAEVATTRYWDISDAQGMIEHDLISTIEEPRVGTVQVRWNEEGGRVDVVETGNPTALEYGASTLFTTSCWDARALVTFDAVYSDAGASAYALARGDASDCAIDMERDELAEYGEDMESPDWSEDLAQAEEFSGYDSFSSPYGDPIFEEDNAR